MELEKSTFLTSDYTKKLHSSIQYNRNRNIDQWNKVEIPETNPHTYGSLTKEAICNGEKTVSSTSGAVKTGQLQVKE